MIKVNIIKNSDKSCAIDFKIDASKNQLMCEYILILYEIISKNIVDKEDLEMLYHIVQLSLAEGCKDFDEFSKGVIGVYLNR
jgi:hypothetical protein